MRIEIENSLDPDMPKPELYPSPVVGNPGSDNCLGLFYRVDVYAVKTWARNTNFLSGSLGYSVEEPEVTEDFREFPRTLSGNIWESRMLRLLQLLYGT